MNGIGTEKQEGMTRWHTKVLKNNIGNTRSGIIL